MASRTTAARVVLQKAIWCGLRLTALPKGLMNPYRRVATWTSTSARELRVIFTIRIYEFYEICCWIWGVYCQVVLVYIHTSPDNQSH